MEMVEKGQQLRIEPLGMNVDYGGHSQFKRGVKALLCSHFFVSVLEETEREYVVPSLQLKQIFEPINISFYSYWQTELSPS